QWWKATCSAIKGALEKKNIKGEEIDGIGLTGQMHSSVFLDEKSEVIRPAILWCDNRTAKQVDEVHKLFGREKFIQLTCNPVLTGFTLPKILWLKETEPANYKKIKKILLPKDYIRFKLTGEFASDVSDASGTSVFDVKGRKWSDEVLRKLGLDKNFFPKVYESSEITGKVNGEAAKLTGLKVGIPVVAGAGDQAASAISCGIYEEGVMSATLGTSGVIFASTDSAKIAPEGKLHSFCHSVKGKWHLMGVVLSAGGSFKWVCDSLCDNEKETAKKQGVGFYYLMDKKAEEIPIGSEGLIFLPYLTGERTPHQDPDAKGVFFGLSLKHNKFHFVRAVMEGVGFALRDSLELMRDLNIKIEEVRFVGGGAKSQLWRGMLADIFESPIRTLKVEEGAPYGALLLAGIGVGAYKDVADACKVIKLGAAQEPNPKNAAVYRNFYALYRDLYKNLKGSYKELSKII
ncbi:MAG: xylulokinase, partial [Candidatus Ratteibacteria bacterium]|nr:xylulokinase [Candidatus Ratteibacteria bacterium]